jgi:type IV pilus assembly protein PilQ
MRSKLIIVLSAIIMAMILAAAVAAQENLAPPPAAREVITYKPDYIPPSDILTFLGANTVGNLSIMRWLAADGTHAVDIRHNAAANIMIISGEGPDVDHVLDLIREADIAPRQIEIEVKILQVNTSKARDIGLDWEQLIYTSLPRGSWSYSEDWRDGLNVSRVNNSETIRDTEDELIQRRWSFSSNINLNNALKVLDEAGVGKIRTAPRILTLNNRRATILDGQRVTYVTRYSSYTNLFETDSMDAGITVRVLPSIGESGYITLDIDAELTSLGNSISGSPIKEGQLIENTVIVKDGESVLLGGLTRTVEMKSTKRFPVLGYILPVIFSRESTAYENIESYMILTPRVVDFSTALDEHIKSLGEDKGGETGK